MSSSSIRTSAQVRQDFLDFFKSKQHTIVPSSSLMPDSPNLLFTNAGMNQFVPIFLGQVKCPYNPPRAADTQKCIRAGGKHNDLEDVGLDTYHHTFFEMLGNWSFGDYFKKEAIEWAWELITEVWKFPKNRVYATVYSPDKSLGDPSEFDQEAYDFWAAKFSAAGLDPKVHIVYGNKKDNFWIMGETGPCGPCSELHIDLTAAGDTKGALVNKGSPQCIEIWNLVFIQFNANPDGTFSPLPAQHVDTGMGFERVTSILQCTKNFTDFTGIISNYETDIFRPIFDKLEKLSGKRYGSTLPGSMGSAGVPPAPVGVSPTGSGASEAQKSKPSVHAPGATYHKRRLPHFERPWGKYMVTFSTRERRQLSSQARDVVLKSLLFGNEQRRYLLYAACVMPDHVHMLLEPQIKEQDKDGQPVFWPLTELLHSIKSFTAHEINKQEQASGQVWENESFDRLIRSDSDLEEKFNYICGNPWDSGVAQMSEAYPWLWTPDAPTQGTAGRDARQSDRDGRAPHSAEQEKIDIAFRVIADHIRTLSFAIADGIQPGNNDRNYVLRRILRRAVRYGRTLGFHEPFFYKLVDVLAETMGHVFPEIQEKRKHIQQATRDEEEAFNKTLDQGISLFTQASDYIEAFRAVLPQIQSDVKGNPSGTGLNWFLTEAGRRYLSFSEIDLNKLGLGEHAVFLKNARSFAESASAENWHERNLEFELSTYNIKRLLEKFSGGAAFLLYDTYGFPFDLTELIARERGLSVDKEEFGVLMEQQKARSRAGQIKEVISLSQIETTTPTKFIGYDTLETQAKVLEVVGLKDKTAVVLDTSALYAEMGGQVGDAGELSGSGQLWRVANTQKSGNTWLHIIEDSGGTRAPRVAGGALAVSSDVAGGTPATAPETGALPVPGNTVTLTVDRPRRNAIQRHHTVTHLLHWALHEVVSREASQKGSFVGPDKLTFDFNSPALTPAQVSDVEKLVNERIVENAGVSWTEVPYADVKSRKDVMQFFGDKYGELVRVVQIGGHATKLDGYSMELCGGTHTRATGEIGLFRIVGESAIAAGVRRIEAVAGLEAYRKANDELQLIKTLAGKVNSPVHELEKKIESLLEHQKAVEKQLRAAQQREASNAASELLERVHTFNGTPAIVHNVGGVDGDFLQAVVDSLKGRFKGVVVLGGACNGAVSLVASVSPDYTAKVHAGKIIQNIAPLVGGKGGGKPDNARGGGKEAGKLEEALARARSLLG